MNFMTLKKLMIVTKNQVIDLLALEKEYKAAMKRLKREIEDELNDDKRD